jgi:hypothetical protein
MSQIVRHFPLFILFTQIRLNFSTSISTSPVTYTVRSPVTSPASPSGSPTTSYPTETRLTGYATILHSRYRSCSDPYYATTSLLNSCYQSYYNTSRLVYATSSAVVEKIFSDSQCSIPAGVQIIPYTEGKCNPYGVYISPSVVRNSDIGGVTIR